MHWEELMKNMTRPLTLCDLDFTDLRSDDDKDDLMPRGLGGSVPPPPPPIGIPPPMKPMQTNSEPPPNFRQMNGSKATIPNSTIKKNKKTVRKRKWNISVFSIHIHEKIMNFLAGKIILERNSGGSNSTKLGKNHLGWNSDCNDWHTKIGAPVRIKSKRHHIKGTETKFRNGFLNGFHLISSVK